MRTKKISAVMCMVFVLVVLFCVPVYASGDVAGAIEGTWQTASQQIKTVVDHVVFPAIDLILAVFFFGKLGTAYFDYRKHGQFEWAAPAILYRVLYHDARIVEVRSTEQSVRHLLTPTSF